MSAGAPAIPAPGPFPGSHAPPIGQLRVARRPNRPQSGPLRAFQPQGHTPAGYPPETPEAPVNAVSKRRWLRALRSAGAPRVLGPAVSQPSPGPAIEGPRNPSSRCCSAQFTAARLRAVGRVRACSDRSGSMSVGAPAIPAPGPFSGSHAPPIGQLRVARRPNRPHSGPLRAFQPRGHTSGHPPETSVNTVSKRRWLRALHSATSNIDPRRGLRRRHGAPRTSPLSDRQKSDNRPQRLRRTFDLPASPSPTFPLQGTANLSSYLSTTTGQLRLA